MSNIEEQTKTNSQGTTWSRYKVLIPVSLFLLTIIVPRYLNFVPDAGEIWNYQYARRILYGQIPYKDFAMLQTPFSAQMNALFLYIFSDQLIVVKIIGGLIGVINGLITFLIFKKLGKNDLYSVAYTLIFIFPFFIYSQNTYSWYAVLFLTLALYLEMVRFKSKGIILELSIGICLGLCAISKQNIGFFGFVASCLFLIILAAILNKEETGRFLPLQKKSSGYFWKCISLKILGCLIPILAETAYLWEKGGLLVFVHNMLAVTTQFAQSSSISYIAMLSGGDLYDTLLAIVVPIFILTPLVMSAFPSVSPAKKKMLLVSGLYAAANYSMMFPIADSIHITLAMPLSIVAIASCSFDTNPIVPGRKTLSPYYIVFIIAAFWLLISTDNVLRFNIGSYHYFKHYEYIKMTDNSITSIQKVDEFILREEQDGKKVYFFNYQSDYYLIPLDQFSYRYDTVTNGSPAEQEMIQMLASSQNIVVIIRGEHIPPMRIETRAIEDYVRATMTYVGTVNYFDVYTK
jgi:4-amino-4-deoxy-L-arabinose transferase and related glycosyltransferases of PMT family